MATVLCSAQKPKFSISGYVTDKSSGERIPGITVFDAKSKQGTATNAYGFYTLTLNEDSVKLRIAFVGYKAQVFDLYLNKNIELNVELEVNQTREVVIQDENAKIENRTQMSVVELPVELIKSVPALFGEVDIIKVLQMTPGVHSGGEGSTGMYVRGGGPDQNLILLDGVPVYNVSHLFGFFSVFNADAIKSVSLTKGGFPARYGGRLSSVLDIQMKEGNMKEFHGEGGIGIIASRLTLEGPIVKDKGSFIISGRRTYVDVLTAPIIAAVNNGNSGGYYFYDLNAKVNYILGKKDRVYLSMYNGDDKFYGISKVNDNFYKSTTKFGLGWGNLTASLRWNHQFSDKLFMNVTALSSKYGYRVTLSLDEYIQQSPTQTINNYTYLNFYSQIKDKGVKVDFDYRPLPDHNVKYGGGVIFHAFRPDAIQQKYSTSGQPPIDSTTSLSKPIDAIESYAYIEDEWKVNKKLNVNIGLHLSSFKVQESFYPSLQPRLSMRYLLPKNVAFKASYSKMQQFLHLLTNTGISLPTDLWLPATDKVKPMTSQQFAAGFARSFKNNMFEVSLEGYYKTMINLIEYKEGQSFLGSQDWQNKIETGGKGWSYGSELFIQKKQGKLTGWIGYTLSWTMRQFDNLNDGKKFFYRYDRRHDISVVANYKINDEWSVSGTWVFGTGNAITFPKRAYSLFNSQFGGFYSVYDYGERNSFRMAPYHRLDLGVTKTKKTKWGESSWNFSIYNAYSRLNPYFIFIETKYYPNGSTSKNAVQYSLFPIIPSVTYNFKF